VRILSFFSCETAGSRPANALAGAEHGPIIRQSVRTSAADNLVVHEGIALYDHVSSKHSNVLKTRPKPGLCGCYGSVNRLLPLELEEPIRLEVTALLDQLMADTMPLLY